MKRIGSLVFLVLGLLVSSAIAETQGLNKTQWPAKVIEASKHHNISALAIPNVDQTLIDAVTQHGLNVLSYDPKVVSPQYFSFHHYDFVLVPKATFTAVYSPSSTLLADFDEYSLVDIDRMRAKLVPLKSGELIRRDFSEKSNFHPTTVPEYILKSGEMLLLPYALDGGVYRFSLAGRASSGHGKIVAMAKYRLGQSGKNRQLVKTYIYAVSKESDSIGSFTFSIPPIPSVKRYYVELRYVPDSDGSESTKIKWLELEKL